MKNNLFYLLLFAFLTCAQSLFPQTSYFAPYPGAGGINAGSYNTFIGYFSGNSNASFANYNSFFGYNSGNLNNIGSNLSFFGSNAGFSNTTGSRNSFFGEHSGYSNVEGYDNTFLGYSAGRNIAGNNNTIIGSNAGNDILGGSDNVLIGSNAGKFSVLSSGNILIGSYAGGHVGGLYNLFNGYFSGTNNTTGSFNVFLGNNSGQNNNGSSNVFIGSFAGKNAQGDNMLYISNSSTNSPLIYGEFNNDLLRINGELNINSAYSFPKTSGTNGQILAFDLSTSSLYWTNQTQQNVYTADNGLTTIGPTFKLGGDLIELTTSINILNEKKLEFNSFLGGSLNFNCKPNSTEGLVINLFGTGNFKVNGNVSGNTIDILDINEDGHIIIAGSLQLTNGASIEKFSTDGTLHGNNNSDEMVPTEKAVKTYVDNHDGLWHQGSGYIYNSGKVCIGTPSYSTYSLQVLSNGLGINSLAVNGTTNNIGIKGTGWGQCSSNSYSIGVQGDALYGTFNYGIKGSATGCTTGNGSINYGVSGEALNSIGTSYGGWFYGSDFGVYALASPAYTIQTPVYGLKSECNGSATNPIGYGVFGKSLDFDVNYGVFGKSYGVTGAGVWGENLTNGSLAIYANGNAAGTTWWSLSDQKLKDNINVIIGALDLIKKIKPSQYTYKNSKEISGLYFPTGVNFGFIAQELEKVLPELVMDITFPVDYDDEGKIIRQAISSKAINYIGLIPILTEGIKEQQKVIEEQSSKINDLLNRVESLEVNCKYPKIYKKEDNNFGSINSTNNSELYQNNPNPFTDNTSIEYLIFGNFSKASICIYNLEGVQITKFEINQSGLGSIIVNGNSLKAGIYLYSLIVDKQVIDTKRMTLIE